MHSPLKKLAGAAAALALCVTPTVAAAATTSAVQPVNPLVAVSVFGTPASAAAVFQAQVPGGGPVLPQVDTPPPPPPPSGDFGINWILLGLGALAFLGGIATLFNDDGDGGRVGPISPD
jgi:hypothetical protein